MAWITDPMDAAAAQLGQFGASADPDVLRQVNDALRQPPPQYAAAQTGFAGMQQGFGQQPTGQGFTPQFTAAQGGLASDFSRTTPQFFAGQGYGVGGNDVVGPYLAGEMGNHPWQINSARPATGFNQGFGGAGGSTSVAGGQWATLDSMNGFIDQASMQTGVPANLIKSMLAREGAFGTDKRVVPLRGEYVYAFNGIFQSTAESRGIDFQRMTQDDAYAVWAMGEVLRQIKAETGFQSWDDVAGYYFAGPNWNNPTWGDETGENTVYNYKYGPTGVITRWQQLDQMGGGASNLPTVPGSAYSNNWVVQQALQFVGVDYIWGGIPGVTTPNDPRAGGWDCSGLTFWLNQTYGDGSLPQGSHYQYQYAQRTGQLFTDLNQLQPGDLVFIDTGWQGGAGAELNRAGHVAVYIGNGQILHAANAQQGTIVSPLSGYPNILGGMHQSFSGGSGGGFGGGGFGGGSSSRFFGQGSSFLDYLFG